MKKKVLTFISIIIFIVSLLSALHFYHYCTTAYKGAQKPTTVNIPIGSSLKKTCLILKEKQLINSPIKFMLLAKLTDAEHRIKSGEYSFPESKSPLEILRKLTRGKVITYTITIPEGSTVFDIADIIEDANLGSANSIIQKAQDVSFIKSMGMDNKSLEGFLFPDTYQFTKGISPDMILKRMVMRFKEVFSLELAATKQEMSFSEKELIILASMVEKETHDPTEKPLVAAVFLNRLKKNMRLECDPTVYYGIKHESPSFQGRLRTKHLREKTPYNTYLIYGLPPGPICSPGRISIQAVLKPAKTDYLYFVSKNNGSHQFSRTLKEHNRAVDKYQKNN